MSTSKRQSFKSSILRIAKFSNSSECLNANKSILQSYIQTLQGYWENFVLHQTDVESKSGSSEISFQETEMIDTERVYIETNAKLLAQLEIVEGNQVRSSSSASQGAANINVTTRAEVPLPTLNIPTFTGKPTEWMEFIALFKAHIDTKPRLPNVQKFQYLKSRLDGEAAQLIRNYPLTDANYAIALAALTARYENKRIIANAYLKTLFSQAAIKIETSASLRKVVDTTNDCVRALRVLDIDTTSWDPMLIFLITQKLDATIVLDWERTLKTPDLPTFDELNNFIESRCRAIEAVSSSRSHSSISTRENKSTVALQATAVPIVSVCVICNESHSIRVCPTFLSMTIDARTNAIRENRLCFNCFNAHHSSRLCKAVKCRTCSRKHNILLHPSSSSSMVEGNCSSIQTSTTTPKTSFTSVNNSTSSNTLTHHTATSNRKVSKSSVNSVLLATANVTLQAQDGTRHLVRALMDTGSQASFITEECLQLLKLKRKHAAIKVNGLGTSDAGTSRGMVRIRLGSLHDQSVNYSLDALILSRITTYLPTNDLSNHKFPHLYGLELADKEFYKPGKIDVLLGADVYAHVIMDGIVRGAAEMPIAQRTSLGYIVSGPVHSTHTPTINATSLHVNAELETALKRFWEIESILEPENLTIEEKICNEHFERTHHRNECGKFVVQLPLNEKIDQLGTSKSSALARLKQLEAKFKRNPQLKERYVQFMKEYESLGHMAIAAPGEVHSSRMYFIPHHAVFKEDSTTTKLRVVFDASNRTSTGLSLNDCQLIGPKLQSELYTILLRFRKYSIAIAADITKMYRQIIMNEKDQDLQRILWRENETDDISEYRLCTVTYGTASAPYLAVRSLIECAVVEGANYPNARISIMNDMYVDDLITGADNERDATELQQQISTILARGGFELRKWASNNITVLQSIPSSHRESKELLQFEDGDSVKALGIYWFPTKDQFGFVVKVPDTSEIPSKRNILADTARLFDPLGLLSPIIITAKILLQKLWLLGLDWDEPLPNNVMSQWSTYRTELSAIERIKIPRWLGTTISGSNTELHAFCDASEAAYAAVIYARTVDATGNVSVHLLTSKTKVSPVQQVSLPRLELCGAVLLTKLLSTVKKALNYEAVTCHAWTDSTVVLAWLRKLPCNWKTFVANRVSEIQTSLAPSHWKYVPSKENPADVASRGIMPSELLDHPLWWHGPSWLRNSDQERWPQLPTKHKLETKQDAKKPEIVTMNCIISIVSCPLIEKYSSLRRLKRVTAYVCRFIHNARRKESNRRSEPIAPVELKDALSIWIKQAQQLSYANELACITANTELPRKSQLTSLKPFLDEVGLLRVGGRIDAANLPYNTRHPVILPPKAKITQLILADMHITLLHAGVQLMVAHIRHEFWLPRARSNVREHIHRCLPCFRQKKQVSQQQMGNLPSQRLIPARPFLNSGVDYAGPINIRASEIRNSKVIKGYIAVFVCLVTRAIHLELVSDLTTEAFIAAFRRFIARRGKCQTMMSDNGTNFVGARRELKSLTEILHSQYLSTQLANDGTQWKLIPPSSPHFGGIWEAGVKSVKHHLRRVLGTTKLSFEKLVTVLTQIEACLNSRPLTPLNDDPTDINALTPGHFLIGEPMSAAPDPNVMDLKLNTLSRWQYLQRIQQDFWTRWQKEYIGELQQRPKWQQSSPNVQIGNLVLIKDECLPPTHWPLARISNIHPGRDGLVRVVTLKYNGGNISRPIHKICILPMQT